MCLLTFIPAGVTPDLQALANGAELNPDGHGYAVVAGGRLLIGHGMDAAATIDAFTAARGRHPDGPALFHSRFATHGTTTRANCHPFRVGGDRQTVIAHNGVLPAAVWPTKSDRRSDTRIAAETFLPTFGPLSNRQGRRRLERWMGPNNKMVLLTVDRRFTRRSYLLNEASGIWDDGIWYSNEDYLPAHTLRYADYWDPADDLPGHTRCWICRSRTAGRDFCTVCGFCLDCGDPIEDCRCHEPATGSAIAAPRRAS